MINFTEVRTEPGGIIRPGSTLGIPALHPEWQKEQMVLPHPSLSLSHGKTSLA